MNQITNNKTVSGDISTTTRARVRRTRHAYSEAVVMEILIRVAEGESINQICSEANMPSRSTFYDWVAADESIKAKYELAMQVRADFYAEQIIEIADDASGDSYIDEDGKVQINHENIARAKLRIDARKWYASRMHPKKYGNAVTVEVNRPD